MSNARVAFAAVALLALAACADLGQAPASPPPKECAKDLSYVKAELVTPYDKLDAFLGEGVMDVTLHKPIDDMIEHGGGIDRSIRMGEEQVQEYKNILANSDAVRTQDEKAGQSDEWIDTYLSSVQDGVTINQAFVDQVKCRQAKQQEQSESPPAS
jgi:hypothetical protein